MRALLLAAGRGTRLGSLSRTTPKCLQQIGDEILIDRLIRQLSDVGVERFLINTHHLAEHVASHIQRRADNHRFELVHEPILCGTLGALRNNRSFFRKEPGWVLHADNYIEGTLDLMIEKFSRRPREAWGTMLTFDTEAPSTCGVVAVDDSSLLAGFWEKVPDPPSVQASAATFLLDRRGLDFASSLPDQATDISTHLLPHLVGRVAVVPHTGNVIDIGTIDGLNQARAIAAITK